MGGESEDGVAPLDAPGGSGGGSPIGMKFTSQGDKAMGTPYTVLSRT